MLKSTLRRTSAHASTGLILEILERCNLSSFQRSGQAGFIPRYEGTMPGHGNKSQSKSIVVSVVTTDSHWGL
jgi:hypothetical protein